MSIDKERVVITGLGVISPNANGTKDFTAALRAGKSGIRHYERLKELGFACQVGGIPENLDELKAKYFSEDMLRAMNSGMIYASLAGIEAWIDSGLPYPGQTGSEQVEWDTSAIIGCGVGGVDTLGEWVIPQVNEGKVRRLGSTNVERTMSSAVSARLGGILALGGQVTTNSSACTTGTEAIIDGYHMIREGRSKRVLAGGAEGSSHYIWAGFDAMRVLCRDYNSTPEQASRPMSATAGGFVPSSGAGILMLESLKSAEARGARIYAEVLGGKVNCGGQRNGGSMTAPSTEGVIRCVRAAVTAAGIRPGEIDLINGHLTATMADPRELNNWQQALELNPVNFPLIQSTKSLIGHALGAAGGIECVASILQLHHGFVHASINCEDLRPELHPFETRVPRRSFDLKLGTIAKASFGFGDVNGCAIFRKWKN